MDASNRDIAVISLPCGSIAHLDQGSGTYSYVCTSCFSVVGSISQPEQCRTEQEKWDIVKKLGGKAWDYNPRPS